MVDWCIFFEAQPPASHTTFCGTGQEAHHRLRGRGFGGGRGRWYQEGGSPGGGEVNPLDEHSQMYGCINPLESGMNPLEFIGRNPVECCSLYMFFGCLHGLYKYMRFLF